MKSASNGGILNGSLQVLHIHVLLVAPLGTGHMAQAGADQHEGGVAIREGSHHAGAAADLSVGEYESISVNRYSSQVFYDKIQIIGGLLLWQEKRKQYTKFK